MDLERFYFELEEQKLKRQGEITRLNNLLQKIPTELKLDETSLELYLNSVRRANICLIYAHIEGFVKFAFTIYITAINQLNLNCQDVLPIFRAAVYVDDFKKLTDIEHKSKRFKKSFPFDNHLHRLFRQEEFFESISDYLSIKVQIKDKYINTESNVGKEVLEKLLYQVGLPHDCLSSITGILNELKNKRNDISHGVDMSVINEKNYLRYVDCAFRILDELVTLIFDAYKNKKYRYNL
ncbi:MAE_28990/MAE_18760 family HEPN-like nuclease [Gilliamella sp. Imp1-1]|uniref:MAE_28990/MAE_18760 family HEPN-like nuclease n=1 Tax=Gilliamella sp. Imp1-1 TaxID=3120248 RepID=UPI000461C33A|nr:MAE_28990/MAE_18760 family HEPN-like nuclease [Gilliamella apicola]KDN11379.1 hypothetical protein GAPWKB30_0079 [Gilliamella apicola]OCG57518.1 hypothetical protein A9G38_07720 [Gilliamella apicola]